MSMRVIGLGSRLAGDDAVGLAIVERLDDEGVPPGVELLQAPDTAGLISLLQTPHPVIIVDAVLGAGPPGELVELAETQIGAVEARLVSTHGLDVAGAITLARILFGEEAAPDIGMLGVRIAEPARFSRGLSPISAAAVARAARTLRWRMATFSANGLRRARPRASGRCSRKNGR
jgi:hydrogenase maturation protease